MTEIGTQTWLGIPRRCEVEAGEQSHRLVPAAATTTRIMTTKAFTDHSSVLQVLHKNDFV